MTKLAPDMETYNLTWSALTELKPENVSAIQANIQGVYRVSYKEEGDESFYVCYVAGTEDIRQALTDQLNNSANACIAHKVKNKSCAFRWAEITQEDVRKAAVWQIYNHYQPGCNDVAPEVKEDIAVNIS